MLLTLSFPGGSVVKNLPVNARDMGLVLGSERSPGGGYRLPHLWDSPGKNTGVGCHFLLQCMEVKSESEAAQSFPTLSDPMDCSLPGSSIHVIFQARILEWGDIASFHYFLEYFNRKSRHTDSLKENYWG